MANMSSGGGLSNGKLELASATEAEVLSGETFYAQDKELKTGTMANQGAWSATIDPGGSVTIPQGYHNGGGKVSNNNTVSQTTASQSVANGTSTATVTFTKDAKVVIVIATGNGYGPGTCINQQSSSAGFDQLVSTGYFTEHSFGTWGTMYYVGYGINVKAGTNLVLRAFQQGGNITIRYID